MRTFLLYFLAIGAGYILIEVALIQKFVLFLGHPTGRLDRGDLLPVGFLSGLGSYFSRRILGNDHRRLYRALMLIAVLVALLAAMVTPVLAAGVGLPLALKFVITVLLISPAGFVMGMPFPAGLKRLEAWHRPSVRWAWSLNAAASVLGSVGALVCGIYLGLVQTLLAGGLLYLAALTVVALTPGVRHDPALDSGATRAGSVKLREGGTLAWLQFHPPTRSPSGAASSPTNSSAPSAPCKRPAAWTIGRLPLSVRIASFFKSAAPGMKRSKWLPACACAPATIGSILIIAIAPCA